MKKLMAVMVILIVLLITVIADAAPRVKYTGVARDRYGNVIPSATVSIYLAGTTTAASVYTTETSSTIVNSVTTDASGVYSFWVDAATYAYSQRFKTVTTKTGYLPQTNDYLYNAYFPTDAAGCLQNDGNGVYSWGTCGTGGTGDTLPDGGPGFLYRDAEGAEAWVSISGEAVGDMLMSIYDTDENGVIDVAALPDLSTVYQPVDTALLLADYDADEDGVVDIAAIPDLSSVYDAAGTAAAALSGHNSAYNHANFLTSVNESTISLSDITTNNASTAKHGFLPKLNNSMYAFLNGQGNWSTLSLAGPIFGSQGTQYKFLMSNYVWPGETPATSYPSWEYVTENSLSFTDNTTGDATDAKHGLMPKLSGDSGECFLGDGTWGACGTGVGDLLADGTVPLTADWDAGEFTITALGLVGDTVATSRTDNPSIVRWYESTSDGDAYKDFISPAKGTGFAANRTHTLGDYDSTDVLSTNIDSAGNIKYLHDVDGVGNMSVTGLTAAGGTKQKTVRDANDTILELGGSYATTGNWTPASGTWNMASVTVRLPQGTSLPGTCSVGDMFMDTDATSGQRFYLCESENTWRVQGDGTGAEAAIDDSAYSSGANGDTTHAFSRNALYDYLHVMDTDDDGKVNVLDIAAGMVKTDAGGVVSVATDGTDYLSPSYIVDTAYGAGWDTDTTHAPSKNAVYDQMELRATKADPVFTGSVQLPNGANPTVDAAGEIAVDTSAGTGAGLRVYAHATYGAVTIPLIQTQCWTIKDPTTSSDHILWRSPVAATARATHCLATGGTSLTGRFHAANTSGVTDGNNTALDGATTMTCTAGSNVNDDGALSNPAIAAGEYITWETTAVSGTQTEVVVCLDFTFDSVN